MGYDPGHRPDSRFRPETTATSYLEGVIPGMAMSRLDGTHPGKAVTEWDANPGMALSRLEGTIPSCLEGSIPGMLRCRPRADCEPTVMPTAMPTAYRL